MRKSAPEAKGAIGGGHRGGDPGRSRPLSPTAQEALSAALDHYRSGLKDIHEAAAEAGVEDWDFLEAAQATPDPIARETDPEGHHLRPFVRQRRD